MLVDKVQFFCDVLWWSVSVNICTIFFNFLVLFIYFFCFMFRSIFYQLFSLLFFVYHHFWFLQRISNKNKISFARKKHHAHECHCWNLQPWLWYFGTLWNLNKFPFATKGMWFDYEYSNKKSTYFLPNELSNNLRIF